MPYLFVRMECEKLSPMLVAAPDLERFSLDVYEMSSSLVTVLAEHVHRHRHIELKYDAWRVEDNSGTFRDVWLAFATSARVERLDLKVRNTSFEDDKLVLRHLMTTCPKLYVTLNSKDVYKHLS